MAERRRASADHEYDFHGMRAHEAERRLKSLLDKHAREPGCVLAIVHGKGSGVLAKLVGDVAARHAKVAHVLRGYLNEGVTRIEMS